MDLKPEDSPYASSTIGVENAVDDAQQGERKPVPSAPATTVRVVNNPVNDIGEVAEGTTAAEASCLLSPGNSQEEERPAACVFDHSLGSKEAKRSASLDALDRVTSRNKEISVESRTSMVDRRDSCLWGAEVGDRSSACSRPGAAASASPDPRVSDVASPSAKADNGFVGVVDVATTVAVVVEPHVGEEVDDMLPSKIGDGGLEASSRPCLTATPTRSEPGAEAGPTSPNAYSPRSPTPTPPRPPADAAGAAGAGAATASAGGKGEKLSVFELNPESAVWLLKTASSRSPEKETAPLLRESSEPSPERSPSRHAPDAGNEANETAPTTASPMSVVNSTQAAARQEETRSLTVSAMAPSLPRLAPNGLVPVQQAISQRQQHYSYHNSHQHGPCEYREGGSFAAAAPAEAYFVEQFQGQFHQQSANYEFPHPGNVHQDGILYRPPPYTPPPHQHPATFYGLSARQQRGPAVEGVVQSGSPYSGYRLPESGRARLQLPHGGGSSIDSSINSGFEYNMHRGAGYAGQRHERQHHEHHRGLNEAAAAASRGAVVASGAPASQAAEAVFVDNETAYPPPPHSLHPSARFIPPGIGGRSRQGVSRAETNGGGGGVGAESKSTAHITAECKPTAEDFPTHPFAAAAESQYMAPRAPAESKSCGAAAGGMESKALPSEYDTVSAAAFPAAANGNASVMEGSGHVATLEAREASAECTIVSCDVAGDDTACSPSLGGVAGGAGCAGRGREGDARRNNAYNDIGLVVTRTKELEKILKDFFGASGERKRNGSFQ